MGSSPTRPTAQIELGKLLAMAQAGRQPDSDVRVAQLLDQYVSTAGWDVSTRESSRGYIRRTIKPALGSAQVRKVRGPLLDTLYARLMRCGKLACTGMPFTEHRNIPDLRPDPADPRPARQQAADKLRAAIRSAEPVAFNYVVCGGRRVRKDIKTHRDRWLAINAVTCALIVSYLAEIKAELAAAGVQLRDDAYLFSNDPAHARPRNPDWVTHRGR